MSRDVVTEPQHELDPEPTLFGTARLAEGEFERALKYLENRAARLAFGAQLRARLVGNPIAAANIRADYQPLRDVVNDFSLPANEIEDDDPLLGNWGANL